MSSMVGLIQESTLPLTLHSVAVLIRFIDFIKYIIIILHRIFNLSASNALSIRTLYGAKCWQLNTWNSDKLMWGSMGIDLGSKGRP
mgnify:CR=1 FL=1